MFAPSISLDTIKVINLEERVKELEEVNNILYKELEIVNTQRFNLAIELADKCRVIEEPHEFERCAEAIRKLKD